MRTDKGANYLIIPLVCKILVKSSIVGHVYNIPTLLKHIFLKPCLNYAIIVLLIGVVIRRHTARREKCDDASSLYIIILL